MRMEYPVNRVSLHFSGIATPEKCRKCLSDVTEVTRGTTP